MNGEGNQNTNETKSGFAGFLPWWVWIVVTIEIAVPTIFGIATCFNPATYIADADQVTYTILLYITRNLTTALGLLLAVLFRSHIAVFILIIVRMTTDGSDMINAVSNGAGESVVQSIPYLFVILIVIPLIAQVWLWKHIRD